MGSLPNEDHSWSQDRFEIYRFYLTRSLFTKEESGIFLNVFWNEGYGVTLAAEERGTLTGHGNFYSERLFRGRIIDGHTTCRNCIKLDIKCNITFYNSAIDYEMYDDVLVVRRKGTA